MIERTLLLIKPDAVGRGLIGEMILRFERAGLKIAGMKMIWIEGDFAKKHYAAHLGKTFYPALEEFITGSPLVAIAAEGVDAVEVARKIVGDTEPKSASPGTIRGDYAHHSYESKKGNTIKNLVHASGNSDEAKQELGLWFDSKELFDYETAYEGYVF